MDLHPTTLSAKLSGRTDWTRQEIEDASRLLELSAEDIHAYFFTL
jgi:hypothetical protein